MERFSHSRRPFVLHEACESPEPITRLGIEDLAGSDSVLDALATAFARMAMVRGLDRHDATDAGCDVASYCYRFMQKLAASMSPPETVGHTMRVTMRAGRLNLRDVVAKVRRFPSAPVVLAPPQSDIWDDDGPATDRKNEPVDEGPSVDELIGLEEECTAMRPFQILTDEFLAREIRRRLATGRKNADLVVHAVWEYLRAAIDDEHYGGQKAAAGAWGVTVDQITGYPRS